MFWSIKALVYFWAFSFLVVSNFWCLFTSPMGRFSNKIFHHKKNMFVCASVYHGPNIQWTLIRFMIPTLVLFQKFMKQYLVKFSLTSSLPSGSYFFNGLKLEKCYSLFVSVNLPLQYFSISFKLFFLVFNLWFHIFQNIIDRNE